MMVRNALPEAPHANVNAGRPSTLLSCAPQLGPTSLPKVTDKAQEIFLCGPTRPWRFFFIRTLFYHARPGRLRVRARAGAGVVYRACRAHSQRSHISYINHTKRPSTDGLPRSTSRSPSYRGLRRRAHVFADAEPEIGRTPDPPPGPRSQPIVRRRCFNAIQFSVRRLE